MKKRLFLKWIGLTPLIVTGVAAPLETSKAPIATNPVVNLEGRISRVELHPGDSMPAIVVDVAGNETRVLLGSMRYLMEQNFNPKAGVEVNVKGYKTADAIVAIEVKLNPDGKLIRLRDEGGWPLWRHQGARGKGKGRAR